MLIALGIGGLLSAAVSFALFIFGMRRLARNGIRHYGRELVAVELDCTACTAGVQWLGRGGWRTPWESAEAPFSRSTAIANSRDCPCCTGIGSHVYYADGEAQAARLKAPCEVR